MIEPDLRIPMPAGIPPLILGSGSPRRSALLGELGVPFRIVVSDVAENVNFDFNSEAQAMALAERKARAVAAGLETGIVLGADTIVSLDGELLGKPVDDADAKRMLRLLSGREHRVVTGIAVIDAASGAIKTSAVSSLVRFHVLRDVDIDRYVATGEPQDKAGAYAIQGRGAGLVSSLDGCFTNVVGLPLCATARLLGEAGIPIGATWAGCRSPDGARCPPQV